MGCMEVFDDKYEVCPYCGYVVGTVPAIPYIIKPGLILKDRYIIGNEISADGRCVHYIGWDEENAGKVMISEYCPLQMQEDRERFMDNDDQIIEYEKGRQQFLKESDTLKDYNVHPLIQTVIDSFIYEERALRIRTCLDVSTVKSIITKRGALLSNKEIYRFADDISNALLALHNAGLIHKDISPNSILATEQGKFYLLVDQNSIYVNAFSIFNGVYASPATNYTKSTIGIADDIYSFAATIYYVATGIAPDESVERLVQDNMKSPIYYNPNLTISFSNAIMRGMELNPKKRYRNMKEFRRDLFRG